MPNVREAIFRVNNCVKGANMKLLNKKERGWMGSTLYYSDWMALPLEEGRYIFNISSKATLYSNLELSIGRLIRPSYMEEIFVDSRKSYRMSRIIGYAPHPSGGDFPTFEAIDTSVTSHIVYKQNYACWLWAMCNRIKPPRLILCSFSCCASVKSGV